MAARRWSAPLLVSGSSRASTCGRDARAGNSTSRYARHRGRESPTPEQSSASGRVRLSGASPAGLAEQRIDLVAIRPTDRHPVQPLDVLDVASRDLAQRPAGETAEREDTARWITGRGACAAEPIAGAHRGRVVATALGRPPRAPVAGGRFGGRTGR